MPPPPLLLSPNTQTYQAVLAAHRSHIEYLLRTHQAVPFIYPYHTLGPGLLILYLLIPPTSSKAVYYLRYPLFAVVVYLSVEAILECRSESVVAGYGIGLLSAWTILWTASLLVFNDVRADGRRIEAIKIAGRHGEGGSANDDQGQIQKEKDLNGEVGELRRRDGDNIVRKKREQSHDEKDQYSQTEKYVYQGLPESFWHRLDWVCDISCSFRAARWKHRISGLPPPPPHIQQSLEDPNLLPPNQKSLVTRTSLIWRNVPQFFLCLLTLDAVKTITMEDPYFWSLPPSTPSPFPYPRLSRLLISMISCYIYLQTIFILSPLVFPIILGARRTGQHAWPWLYGPFFGSPRQVSRKGLAGAWGQWWQQIFRFGFEEAGEFAGRLVGWGKKSYKGTVLRVAVAFACSGALHACASYTTLRESKPMHRSFAFFMVQPLGLLGQRLLSGWIRKAGLREKLPERLREAGNLLFVFGWFYVTGTLISDDFAATGIWLVEPLPFSLFRGLRGDGWWWWGGKWVRWYAGDTWWRSGLAV